MSKETEKEVEEVLEGQEKPVTENEPQKEEEKGESSPATDTGLEVLGRKYEIPPEVRNNPAVQELIKDYDRLGRSYAPTLAQVREIQAKLREFEQRKVEEPQEEVDEATLNYLKKILPKLGVVTREEIEQREEDRRLEGYLQSLEEEFDGSDGRPKFDRKQVIEYCLQHGISDPRAGYILMNFDAIKEVELKRLQSAPTPPPSAKSAGEKRIPPKKKITFGIPKEGEISLREAIEAGLEEAKPKFGEE